MGRPIMPAMAMRITGIGSQHLRTTLDADKSHFDGAKTYRATLPKGITGANFWWFTLYGNMSGRPGGRVKSNS